MAPSKKQAVYKPSPGGVKHNKRKKERKMKIIPIMILTLIIGIFVIGANAQAYYDISPLGILGGAESWPSSINNFGQVVGVSQVDYSHITRPFLWDNGIIIALNELLSSDSDWELIHAEGINDAGYIIGKGSLAGGGQEPFL
jgi:probable HAF family extracellular repeat protein